MNDGVEVRFGAATDVGLVREVNEDSYLAAPLIFQTFAPGPRRLNAALGSTTYNGDASLPETWSEDLVASFPGGRRVVLNGPGSRTRLCLYGRSAAPSECVGEPNPLLAEGPFGLDLRLERRGP